MVNNSNQPELSQLPNLWQSLPLPQKIQLINVVSDLVQRQLTKQHPMKGGCHECSLTPSHD